MAIQNLQPAAVAADPRLRLDDIQGDVLVGLQKDAECFVFFVLTDVPSFQRALSDPLHREITSTSEVIRREAAIAAAKVAGNTSRLPLLGLNIGFTFQGLQKLTGLPDLGAQPADIDASFRDGAVASAAALGDILGEWREPFAAGAVDGVLLITGPGRAEADAHANAMLALLGKSVAVVYREIGAVRPERGHEHFGFLDGVSQPGIRGLTARENPVDQEQGLPGQDLIWPGEFVFDYPGQAEPRPDGTTRKEDQGPVVNPPVPWMRDGSLMVWRRLEQTVLAFRDAVETSADALGMDRALLAARMVGRWPSGAPLISAPLQDDPTMAADTMLVNAFEYGNDPHQRRCPYAAHIRKTYPRDDLNDAGPPVLAGESGEASVQTRRLRRAGIPFGPEIGDGDTLGAEASRGLMFVCYQTSIPAQFEFVQQSWVNNPGFVFGKTRPGGGGAAVTPGHDPIIGQAAGARAMDEPIPNYPVGSLRSSLPLPNQFVRSTAGAYFFVPSLPSMRSGPLVGK